MMPAEFFSRLDNHEMLFLSGSDRKIFLKKEFSGTYILSSTDDSFVALADEYGGTSLLDDRMIFFYTVSPNTMERRLSFQTWTDRWEVGA